MEKDMQFFFRPRVVEIIIHLSLQPLSARELSRTLSLTLQQTYYYLRKLKNLNIITKYNNSYMKYTLTEKGYKLYSTYVHFINQLSHLK